MHRGMVHGFFFRALALVRSRGNSQQAHDIDITQIQRHDVESTYIESTLNRR